MRLLITAAFLALPVMGAHAAAPEGKKLSEIIVEIENSTDFHYVDEVDWDDDGYYEIEYYLKNGSKVEIKIDPKTGETRG